MNETINLSMTEYFAFVEAVKTNKAISFIKNYEKENPGCSFGSMRCETYDKTALNVAARHGDIKLVNFILDRLKTRDCDISPLLDEALRYAGNAAVVDVMISKGANVRARDSKKATALHFAARSGRNDVVKALLRHGAQIRARDISGVTAAMLAAQRGNADTLRLLANCRANLNATTRKGDNALSSIFIGVVFKDCTEEQAKECLSVLIEHGVDVSKPLRQNALPVDVAKILELHSVVWLIESTNLAREHASAALCGHDFPSPRSIRTR